jgi:hypothetical protein
MEGRLPPAGSVLLLVDLQKSVDLMQADKSRANPDWGGRNNFSAEVQVARLLSHWRERGWPGARPA